MSMKLTTISILGAMLAALHPYELPDELRFRWTDSCLAQAEVLAGDSLADPHLIDLESFKNECFDLEPMERK
jgi:hypothetical protein